MIGGAGSNRIILGSGGQNIVVGNNGEIDYTYNTTLKTDFLTTVKSIDPLHGGDNIISGAFVSGVPEDVTFGYASGAGTITLNTPNINWGRPRLRGRRWHLCPGQRAERQWRGLHRRQLLHDRLDQQ